MAEAYPSSKSEAKNVRKKQRKEHHDLFKKISNLFKNNQEAAEAIRQIEIETVEFDPANIERYQEQTERELEACVKEREVQPSGEGVEPDRDPEGQILQELPDQQAIDHSELAKQLGFVLDQLKSHLRAKCNISGEFFEIGSYFSRTTSSKDPDFDYLFEINDSSVEIVGSGDSTHPYSFYVKETTSHPTSTIDPDKKYRLFCEQVNDFFENCVQLPVGLRHSGFAKPKFSGIRISQPAVTVLLEWKEHQELSVDITPAYPVIKGKHDDYLQCVQTCVIAKNFPNFSDIDRIKCHVVPLRSSTNLWTISTAHLETRILKKCCTERQQSFLKIKKTGNQIIEKLKENSFQRHSSKFANEITEFVERAITIWKSNGSHDQLRIKIGKLLSIAHLFLPKEFGDEGKLSETLSVQPISFNSAALKQKVIVLEGYNYIEALTNIQQNKKSWVPHALLHVDKKVYKLQLFKVALHSARDIEALVRKMWVLMAAIQYQYAKSQT